VNMIWHAGFDDFPGGSEGPPPGRDKKIDWSVNNGVPQQPVGNY